MTNSPNLSRLCLFLMVFVFSTTNAQADEGGLLPLAYRFDKAPTTYEVALTQRAQVDLGAGAKETSALIKAKVACALEKTTPEGALVVGLRFFDLQGTFTAQGEPVVGAELSQLGDLRSSATLKPTGVVVKTLMPSVNRQIDRTFRLLQDAFLRSLPVLPEGGEAAIGATWEDTRSERYEIKGQSVDTKLTRTFKLVGLERTASGSGRVARIEVKVTLETVSKLINPDDDSALERLGSATGKGHVLFDLDASRLNEVKMEIDYQSKDNSNVQQRSSLTFDLAYAPEG